MSNNKDSLSLKIVFFLTSKAEVCHMLKNYLRISSKDEEDNEEDLACNYISYEVKKNETILKLKLYIVCDEEKFEELQMLYFKNVDIGVVVFDVGKENLIPYEKIVGDIRCHNSNSSIIFLGYKVNEDDIPCNLFDFLSTIQGRYFEFSDMNGLEDIFEILRDYIFLNNQIIPVGQEQ